MTKPPVAIKDADVTLLASLMKDPADAVDAHKAAGTFTPTLAKSVAGYLKNVATYGGKANTALAAGDPVMFYDHLANLEGGMQAWPLTVKAGAKVSVVVYAGGTGTPISGVASTLLKIQSWLSYLY